MASSLGRRDDDEFCVRCMVAWAKLLDGIADTAKGKACNECETHVVDWDWIMSKYSLNYTKKGVFLNRVIINNKTSLGISAKISDWISRICLGYH